MDLYITIDARPAPEFSITATGRDQEICRNLEDHLILNTYREILEAEGQRLFRFRFASRMKSRSEKAADRLPPRASPASRWPITSADCSGTNSQIIGEASRREHHADNASACWMGGLTVARMFGKAEAQVVCIRPKGKWPLLLAVPDQSWSTEEARRALPAQYSRADAVTNIQNSMFLLAAFTQGNHKLLSAALEDRIHQPYRSPLCPLLPCLQELTGRPGILGAALSGAGPSVIVFLDPASPVKRTRTVVAAHLAGRGLHAELLLTSITRRGGHR